MSTQSPVEVRVVFDASKGRGKRSARPMPSSKPRRSGGTAVMVVGFLSVAVSGVLYYGTWWKADPEIYLRLMTKTPLAGDVDVEAAAAQIFGIAAPPESKSKPIPVETTGDDSEYPSAVWSAQTTQIAIGAAAYSWLATSTVSYLLVAMAGGAMLLGGASRRRAGMVIIAISVLAFGAGTYYVYSEFGAYRPTDLRFGMGIIVLLCMGVGAVSGRGGRRATRVAAFSLIVAALVTALGLYVWGQCGALKVEHFAPQALGVAFAVHAAWGVVLFAIANRL